ncbi:hypothetical protein RIF29_25358 [Crotalaria pallida]|uniref:Uncharacterized protein n=1 Tax=Crotalaria pallida TaxID=3830 RepID=A0AAN9ENL9_CROPI
MDEIYRQVEALDDKGVLEKKRYFQRLHEFVYPTTTSMEPPKYKVKTKGGVKGSRKEAAHEKSTKREPSHWENDVMEDEDEDEEHKDHKPHMEEANPINLDEDEDEEHKGHKNTAR